MMVVGAEIPRTIEALKDWRLTCPNCGAEISDHTVAAFTGAIQSQIIIGMVAAILLSNRKKADEEKVKK